MPFVAATAWNISESSICKASWERVGCNRSRNCGRKNPRTLKAAPYLFIPWTSVITSTKIKPYTRIFPVFLIICMLDQPNRERTHLQAPSSSPLIHTIRPHDHYWSARIDVARAELADSFDCQPAHVYSLTLALRHGTVCLSGSALLTRRGVRCGWFSCWMCFSLPWQPKSPYRALSLLIGALAFEMHTMIRPRAWRLSPLLIIARGDFQPRYKLHMCTQLWHIVAELRK